MTTPNPESSGARPGRLLSALVSASVVAVFARGVPYPLQRSWDDGRFIIDKDPLPSGHYCTECGHAISTELTDKLAENAEAIASLQAKLAERNILFNFTESAPSKTGLKLAFKNVSIEGDGIPYRITSKQISSGIVLTPGIPPLKFFLRSEPFLLLHDASEFDLDVYD